MKSLVGRLEWMCFLVPQQPWPYLPIAHLYGRRGNSCMYRVCMQRRLLCLPNRTEDERVHQALGTPQRWTVTRPDREECNVQRITGVAVVQLNASCILFCLVIWTLGFGFLGAIGGGSGISAQRGMMVEGDCVLHTNPV